MRNWCVVVVCCAVWWVSGVLSASSTPVYPNNCFFSVQNDTNGVWWLVDPNGNTFFSRGIDTINPNGETERGTYATVYKDAVKKKYGNFSVWADATRDRLLKWDINTLGAWTNSIMFNKKIPYTFVLDFYRTWATKSGNTFPDFYDPGFKVVVDQIIKLQVVPRIEDPYFMGWVLDNEVHLGPNWWSSTPLLSVYLNYSTSTPGYKAALAFAKSRYSNLTTLNTNWKLNISSWDELNMVWLLTSNTRYNSDSAIFGNTTAVIYFNTTCTALRAADPNHLILGMKYNGYPNKYVSWADSMYGSDVLSIDFYRAPAATHGEITSLYNDGLRKPILFGEFAFRGNDTALPNTHGAGPIVPNQKIRAEYYSNWMRNISKLSYIVGGWMFQWVDQPVGGRGDGENNNYGIVNGTDFEYTELGNAMTQVHPTLEEYHGTTRKMPAKCKPKVTCPNECSGNGVCDTSSGRCICDSHYAGGDCSISSGYMSMTFNPSAPMDDWNTDNGWWWNYETYIRRDNAYTIGNDGVALNLNNSDCPSRCGNSQYAGGGILSYFTYSYGWINVTAKGSTANRTEVGIRWMFTDPESGRDGHQININRTGVSLYSSFGDQYTRVYTGNLTFDSSAAFHTYSLFWASDNSAKFAIDGNLLVNVATTFHAISAAKVGVYHAATSGFANVGANVTQAYVKSIVYETERGNVKATLPTPSAAPSTSSLSSSTSSSSSSTTSVSSSSSGSASAPASTTTGSEMSSASILAATLCLCFVGLLF